MLSLYFRSGDYSLLQDLVRLANRLGGEPLQIAIKEMQNFLRMELFDGIHDYYEENKHTVKVAEDEKLLVSLTDRRWGGTKNAVEVLEPPPFSQSPFYYPSVIFEFVPAPHLESSELLYNVWASAKSGDIFQKATVTAEEALAGVTRYIWEHYTAEGVASKNAP